ncbi:gliding motility-associated lipoprotein GldH [Dysgonomonadaceae bacterium PH5-43]|nr:gliding motility-associated lipoprotein GldH [Dysgonomonadaceae bacterium PH5-43]
MKILHLRKKLNKSTLFLLFTLSVSLLSCSNKETFSEFHSFSNSEWDKSDTAKFEVVISNNVDYEVSLQIRNNNDYSFRNLWLFVDCTNPTGQTRHDSINVELADVYGNWYGKGISLYSLTIPYENIQQQDSGLYRYSIRHGMREDVLKGISDIGLTVSKKTD